MRDMKKSNNILGAAILALLAAGIAACSGPAEPPAPAAAAVSQDVRRFPLGAMTAIALRDGGLELPNDNKVFGVGRTAAEVAEVLGAAGLPTDKLSLSVQPLVVKVGGRVLLFDTGAGSNMGDGAGKLGAALAEAGVTPGDVTDVFISHLHGDHIGGLIDAAGDPVFTNAAIRMSAPEWDTLSGLDDTSAAAFGVARHKQLMLAITADVATFQPGADVLPGMVRAVEVKGHTPGHSAFRIGTGTSSVLYVGDAMHHHIVSVQKPEWTIAFDSDGATGAASRASLLAELAASGQRVYAVHFPFPGLGRIEKRGEGYAWVAEQ
jgi:glyoxylase-like metal-dependent hydrolase (beta-lactamase superfamily II)